MAQSKGTSKRHQPQGLVILHEDRDILVVDKAPGLLTIATDKEQVRTAYHRLTEYVRKGNSKSRHRVFIVHRLDREASGLLLFAKTSSAKIHLQGQWEKVEKKYLAVVHGRLEERTGTISSYLAENRALTVYSTSDRKKGKLSHTQYTVRQESARFSLLEIMLLTGRKHQIRVHLAEHGHPIVGDQKYGPPDRSHKRLALHAASLRFRHPFSGDEMIIGSPLPADFKALLG